MDWLLANPKLLIAAIIICGYAIRLLTQKKPEVEQDNENADPLDRSSRTQVDPAEAERTRRIAEEIRRKIIERQRGTAPPPMPPPIVVIERDEPMEEPEYEGEGPAPRPPPLPGAHRSFSIPPPVEVMPADASAAEAVLQNQRALLERFQALQAERAAGRTGEYAPASAAAALAAGAGAPVVRGHPSRRDLRVLLQNGASLRQIVLLREILGEPPGLQRGPLVLPRR